MPAQKTGSFRDNLIWDRVAATPLIILCLFADAGFAIEIDRQWGMSGWQIRLTIASECSSALFLALQALMVFIRRLPISKAQGLVPKMSAILGANFTYIILVLPKVPPVPLVAMISIILTLTGSIASIIILLTLGKSFSILPQARAIVTHGPYHIVRHPLYLAEQISAFGFALQFIQPWGLLIVLIGFAVQFPRMYYEERILRTTFPTYHDYACHTARIIPFIY